MQRKIVFLILLCFSLVVYAADRQFPATITLGDTTWKLGWHKEDDKLQMAEYVTNGENVDNWTQLFTFQFFKPVFPDDSTPKAFAEFEKNSFEKDNTLTSKAQILSESDGEVIFEFQVTAPDKDQQDEIQRIIKTKDNHFIVLHYVTKKPDMGDAERQKWIGILKNFNVDF